MVKPAALLLTLLLAACADSSYRTEPLPAPEPERSGVVEEVRSVPLSNAVGSIAGTVIGGTAGGAAGHTVGSGRGSQTSSVVGAVAGSIAGNMVANRVADPEGLEITLRLDNGRQLIVVQPGGETFKPGDRVRVLADQREHARHALNAPRMIDNIDFVMHGQSTSIAVRVLRLIRCALHLANAWATVALVYPFIDRPARRRRVQQWSACLLQILALRLHVGGELPAGGSGVLIVANHVSWLDIVAINTVQPMRFVAKSEIRRWPLIGWLCVRAETLFIQRARRQHTGEINRAMAAAMQAGDSFAVFPEGMISHGDTLRPFHASLLQPALECGAGIHPLALRYSRSDGSLCAEADYEGDKSLLESLLQLVSQPYVDLHLQFLPPLACNGRHRRELAAEAAQRIATKLGLAAPYKHAGTRPDPTT